MHDRAVVGGRMAMPRTCHRRASATRATDRAARGDARAGGEACDVTRALKALRKLYTLTRRLAHASGRGTPRFGPLLSELRSHADERVAAAANGVRKAWKSAVAGGEPPAATGSASAKARADAKPEPAPAKKKPRLHAAYRKPAGLPSPWPAPRDRSQQQGPRPQPTASEARFPRPATIRAKRARVHARVRACTRRARAAAAHRPPRRAPPAAIDPFAAAYVSGGEHGQEAGGAR